MNTQIQSIAEGRKTVARHPAHPQANPNAQQRFASKVLALSGILQTTLETNELVALFAKELASFVYFDGLSYHFPAQLIDIELGVHGKHSCEYQLVVSGEELGELRLYRARPFNNGELETIENLLAGLLYPLRNTLLYQRALKSALIDPLTGVKNRSTMDNALHREIELAHRFGSELSVILMDIDHFKKINDSCGHLFGDQVLRATAKCAERTIRESDMLFRYGGEEFLIVLSGTAKEGAGLLAERIRKSVENLDPHPHKPIDLTVSLGVASLSREDTAASLFVRVDAALYRAKQGGRNLVVLD
jgi:diguanylate cyclase (GGDEF)-like protein